MPQMKPRHAAGAMALAVGLVGGFEGLRQNAYRDVVGVPTICFGETRNVTMGDHKTIEQCNALLEGRLQEFMDGVSVRLNPPVPDPAMSAFTSLAYNIGLGAFGKSTVVRLWNAGDKRGACDAILKFNRAGGVVFPGLTRRREAERKLCLEGAE